MLVFDLTEIFSVPRTRWFSTPIPLPFPIHSPNHSYRMINLIPFIRPSIVFRSSPEGLFQISADQIPIGPILLFKMSASSSRSNDEPKSSHKGVDQKQFIVSSGTSVEAANRSVVLSETEVQLEKLALDTQRDQKKKSDACADGGEEVKKFFKLAERGGAAGMRAMLKGPNADVLLSAKVNGVTALSVAIQNGNAEVVELLRAKGAMDEKKKSPVIFALTPQNRWDSDLCDNDITLFEPDRLIAETNGLDSNTVSSVAAELPIPKKDSGIFYYEMKIFKLERNAHVSIGLAITQPHKSCGYQSNGILYGPTAMSSGSIGYVKASSAEPFGVGDVIGCGVDLATRQLIYTKNGARLDTADLFVPSAADLLPIVAFWGSDGKIEANFGPNFKYKATGQ